MELRMRNGDYLPDGVGGVQRLGGMEEKLARALYRLSVPRGSFPFLPELGGELHLLGREKPGQREAAAREYIARALQEEALQLEAAELTAAAEGLMRLKVILSDGENKGTVELTVGGLS